MIIRSFDGKLLAEYDQSGICVKDYIYAGNKLIAEYQPALNKYYYASDQVNSSRVVTDSAGAVVYSGTQRGVAGQFGFKVSREIISSFISSISNALK